MSISKFIYGKDNPSLARKRSIYLVFIILSLFFWGWYSDFVPSEMWLKIGLYISITTSILLTALLWWAYGTGRAKFKENASNTIKLMFYIFAPLFIFGFTLGGIMYGIPSITNRMLGDEVEVVEKLTKEYRASRRTCDYRLVGEFLDSAMPSHLCIDRYYYELEPKEVNVKLKGYKTKLGFLIHSVYE